MFILNNEGLHTKIMSLPQRRKRAGGGGVGPGMLLHGSLLLGSTQECILVWQGKNGKNGTQTGYCQCISLLYSKKPIIISNRERFPRLHRLHSVDVYLWRGVKGFAVMQFCLIFGAVLRKFLFYFVVLQFYKTKRFAVFGNFGVISVPCYSVRCLYLTLLVLQYSYPPCAPLSMAQGNNQGCHLNSTLQSTCNK